MKILELELHKYIRLAFSAIETIRYTPELASQIIIGSNGSGKSSLLMEMNPLPVAKNYMLPGGYKKIKIEHRGITYLLLSTYGKGGKHSFKRMEEDGSLTELNEGGTGMAQKMLVEKVFGLTVELLRLWVGQTRFTDLAPMRRRDWILKLSGSDLDYAMDVFNIVKAMHNDAKAVDRHLGQRLGEETADIADQAQIDQLEDQIATLTNNLNTMLEQKNNSIPSIKVVQTELLSLHAEFENCYNEIVTLRLVKPDCLTGRAANAPAVWEYITEQHTVKVMHEKHLKELYEQKQTLEDTMKALSSSGAKSSTELAEVTKSLSDEIVELATVTPLYGQIELTEIEHLSGHYQGLRNLIHEMLSTLPHNDDQYFKQDKLTKTNAFILKARSYLGGIVERTRGLEHQVKHYAQMDNIDCPECQHNFVPGFQGFDLVATEKEIAELNGKHSEAEKKLKLAEEYSQECTEYFRQSDGFKKIIADNPKLEPLWVKLINNGLYKIHPHNLLNTLTTFEQEIDNCRAILKLQNTVDVNNAIVKTMQDQENRGFQLDHDRLFMFDERISKLNFEIAAVQTNIKSATRFYRNVTASEKAMNRATEIRDQIANRFNTMVQATINQSINQQIQHQQIALATANTALTKLGKHEAVLNDLKKQKAESTEKLQDTAIVLRALSPVDGLISKYIQNFLSVFIGDINEVIGEIWTSSLEILPCGVDSTDVTCKFPLNVNNGLLITPDISESSAGQCDVINFAFRITIAQYLGLHDYPLYLDELAPTLDEQHRENITRYINDLMEGNYFEQMFMISHYASNHYAFGNAEVLLLDSRNIVNKPKAFNRHVLMVYSDEIKELVTVQKDKLEEVA